MDGRRRQVLWRVAGMMMAVLAAGCGSGERGSQPAQRVDYGDEDVVAEAAIDSANAGLIVGSISYLQRIALPKGATIVVELFDVSNANAPSRVARSRFASETQVPIRFQLAYDRTRIDPARPYAVRARILVDRALWFVNDQPVPVLTRGNSSSVEILVRPASVRE